jgi:AcrR family transcriptional regulator
MAALVAEAQRWHRRKKARPAEILAAALDEFAERGYAAAKLDRVAQRAGVTKGTLYLYFPSKAELFKAVVRSAVLPNIAEAERLVAGFPGPASELLRRLVSFIVARIVDTPLSAIPKLVLAEAGNFPELARFYRAEVIERAFALIGAVLARGAAAGEFRRIDGDQAVRCVVAPVLLAALWRHSFGRFDDQPIDAAALARTHLDLLLHGLAVPGGAP